MAYSVINQERIDDILDSGFNLPINTDTMEEINVIGKCDNISIERLGNIGGTLYILNKNNITIKKCDLEENDSLSIDNPWLIEIIDNTLGSIIIKGLTTIAEIKNSYIHKLTLIDCKTVDDITIRGSIIDELCIDSCLLKNGIYISIDSTIRNITVTDSIIDNTNVISSNIVTTMFMNITDEENNKNNKNDKNRWKHDFNIEDDIYEEIFEDIAIERFKMSRSLIINNNKNTNIGYIEEVKKKINVRKYMKKKDCMIAGYYNNNYKE